MIYINTSQSKFNEEETTFLSLEAWKFSARLSWGLSHASVYNSNIHQRLVCGAVSEHRAKRRRFSWLHQADGLARRGEQGACSARLSNATLSRSSTDELNANLC